MQSLYALLREIAYKFWSTLSKSIRYFPLKRGFRTEVFDSISYRTKEESEHIPENNQPNSNEKSFVLFPNEKEKCTVLT